MSIDTAVTPQQAVEVLREGGYLCHFKVRDRRSGLVFLLRETAINPVSMEILEDDSPLTAWYFPSAEESTKAARFDAASCLGRLLRPLELAKRMLACLWPRPWRWLDCTDSSGKYLTSWARRGVLQRLLRRQWLQPDGRICK